MTPSIFSSRSVAFSSYHTQTEPGTSTPALTHSPSSSLASVQWTPTSSPPSFTNLLSPSIFPYTSEDEDDIDDIDDDPFRSHIHPYPSAPLITLHSARQRDNVLDYVAKGLGLSTTPQGLPDEPPSPTVPLTQSPSPDSKEQQVQRISIIDETPLRFSRKTMKTAVPTSPESLLSSRFPTREPRLPTYHAVEETPMYSRAEGNTSPPPIELHHSLTTAIHCTSAQGPRQTHDLRESDMAEEAENQRRWREIREERKRMGHKYPSTSTSPVIGIPVPRGSVPLSPPRNGPRVHRKSRAEGADYPVKRSDTVPVGLLPSPAVDLPVSRDVPYRPSHRRRDSTDSDRTIRPGEGYVALDPLSMTTISASNPTRASSPLVNMAIPSQSRSEPQRLPSSHPSAIAEAPMISEVSMSTIHPSLNRFNRPVSPILPREKPSAVLGTNLLGLTNQHQHQTLSSPPSRARSPATATESLRGVLALANPKKESKSKGEEADHEDEDQGSSLQKLIEFAQRVEDGSFHRSQTVRPSTPIRASTPIPTMHTDARTGVNGGPFTTQRSASFSLPLRRRDKAAQSLTSGTTPRRSFHMPLLRTLFESPSSSPCGDEHDLPVTPSEMEIPDTPFPSQASPISCSNSQSFGDLSPSSKFDADKLSQQLRVQPGRVSFADLEGVGQPEDEGDDEEDCGKGKMRERRPSTGRRWTLPT